VTRQEAPRPARLSRNERREHLLDVAAGLILDKGIEAVTMEGVAAAAGVSKGLGYAYFDNSSTLLRALLEREVGKLNERIVAAYRTADDFESRLRATIHAWFDHVEENGVLMGRLLEATRNDGPHVEARNAYNRFNEKWWADLAERELGVPNARGQIATAIILSGLQGVVRRWTECRDSREELEEVFMRLAMGGLRNLQEDAAAG
jgi:TetR/AcrR family transcriptional regulator, fatty acid biosynthesis regulator